MADYRFGFVRPFVRLDVSMSLHPNPLLPFRQETIKHGGAVPVVHY